MKLAQLGIAILLTVSTAAPAFAADAPSQSGAALSPAGVCVRWGDDKEHVSQAVVVESTGNAQVDEMIATSVKTMKWPAPSEGYNGQWVGVSLAVGGAEPISTLPNCALLDAQTVAGTTAS